MDTYICESCNKQFEKPEKKNKFLSFITLICIYGIILYFIESIQVTDLSMAFSRFLFDWFIAFVAIVHILIMLFKDSGRGKCPYCGSTDFVFTDSVKGKDIIRKIKEENK